MSRRKFKILLSSSIKSFEKLCKKELIISVIDVGLAVCVTLERKMVFLHTFQNTLLVTWAS
jgi:hypothetical protein